MNVLFLNYEYPPLGGGAANATRYLLREFSHISDLSVTLITSSLGSSRIVRVSSNVTIHYLDIGKKRSAHYQSNCDLLTYSFRAFLRARRLKRQGSFDVVHAFFGIPCGFVALLTGLPYIVSLRGSDVPGYNARYALLDKLLFRRLSRLIWMRAQTVVANSQDLRELARKANHHQPVSVIPNGVDTKRFAPAGVQSEASEAIGLSVIGVGRLVRRKCFDILIQAAAESGPVQVTLVGDGPEISSLRALAATLGVSARLTGRLETEALIEELRAHDVFALPSEHEGMSNALLEAMACGLPVVVSDTGGAGELVDGNGVVLGSDREGELAQVLSEYVGDGERVAREGRRSREIALRCSWEAVATEYVGLYRDVTRERS